MGTVANSRTTFNAHLCSLQLSIALCCQRCMLLRGRLQCRGRLGSGSGVLGGRLLGFLLQLRDALLSGIHALLGLGCRDKRTVNHLLSADDAILWRAQVCSNPCIESATGCGLRQTC
jgi:hypothetical protein